MNTFMTLTDDDLKELGVSTFGARRRMILAIQGETIISCHIISIISYIILNFTYIHTSHTR